MTGYKKVSLIITAIIAFVSLACNPGEESKEPATPRVIDGKAKVFTTFYPTHYFARRIGGELTEVICPCPANEDPAFWMPDDKTILSYQGADLIVVNGASFEKWLNKVTLPESRIVDTTKPFAKEFITIAGAVTHSHGPSGEHTHAGIDGHTWLDPINAIAQSSAIRDALCKLLPEKKDVFNKNYEALINDLKKLDARLKELSTRMPEKTLLCSHPAYNYLARRYKWQVKNFHLEPQSPLATEDLKEIETFVKDHPANYMLWESQPLETNVDKLQKIARLNSIVISPCEAQPEQDGVDYLAVMNNNLDKLEKAFPETKESQK